MTAAEQSATAWWSRVPAIVLDIAAITAVLYFFGWVRTDATYRTLNVNVSVLSLNPAAYVYRGFIVLLPTIVIVGLSVVAASALHRWLAARPIDSRRRRTRARRILLTARVLGWIGLTAAAAATIEATSLSGTPPDWLPYALTGGSAALGYADLITPRKTRNEKKSYRVRASALAILCLAGTLILIMSYAERLGVQQGQQFLATTQDQPTVALYSKERLGLAGAGVEVVQLVDEGSQFRYRYTGLVLLIRSGDDYLLVPRGITPNSPRPVFVIPKNAARIELGTQ